MTSSPHPAVHPSLLHLSLVGYTQLSNSGDLTADSGIARSSESDLVLHAFAKWGDSVCRHLSGRFSFAIWDRKSRRLVACRDHLGTLPFVYTVEGRKFSFAGDMETLLDGFAISRELNPNTLAACSFPSASDLAPGETLFKNVCSLPPGHYLVATAQGVSIKKYWEPSIREELIPTRDDEVFERTAELVDRAVSNWIEKRTGIALMFSGGLDSSVLAAVVSKHLKKSNRTFLALGAVNQFTESGIPDERDHMAALCGLENMCIRHVPAIGRGPFDGIDDISRFRTTCFRYSRKFFDEEIARVATESGADILLGGGWGEATISESPYPYLLECDLACGKRIP